MNFLIKEKTILKSVWCTGVWNNLHKLKTSASGMNHYCFTTGNEFWFSYEQGKINSAIRLPTQNSFHHDIYSISSLNEIILYKNERKRTLNYYMSMVDEIGCKRKCLGFSPSFWDESMTLVNLISLRKRNKQVINMALSLNCSERGHNHKSNFVSHWVL